MARRRAAVATAWVVLGALAATGAAYAGSSEREPGERQARDHRALCERLESKIQHLRAAIGHLQALADRIEQKIASGELTPEQEARARNALAMIAHKQAKLEERLEKLARLYEEKCD